MKRTMAARGLGLPTTAGWSQINAEAERLVASGLATPAAVAPKRSGLDRALAASGLPVATDAAAPKTQGSLARALRGVPGHPGRSDSSDSSVMASRDASLARALRGVPGRRQ